MHTHLVPHPRRLPLTIECGDGCYVFDEQGRRYLDFVSGIGVNALGYNHPRITATIAKQAARCLHTSDLYSHPYQSELARELCRIAKMDRTLFTNSGTESTEAALKLAQCYGQARRSNKTKLVALQGSFHGRTRGALAVAGQTSLRDPFGPYALQVQFIEPNDNTALADAVGTDTAALILEPVMGEGGVRPLSASFLQEARNVTRRNDALLIADECQCGLGRTGAPFAFEWAGVQPDIVTVAKPLAAGLPLGAVMFTDAVNKSFPAGSHATTFGGGPLACRVALEFLSAMGELLPHIREVGAQMRSGLEEIRSRRTIIREIRTCGLMMGIELHVPGHAAVRQALDRGLLINCTQNNVLRLLPPYILSPEQAQEGVQMLDEVLASA